MNGAPGIVAGQEKRAMWVKICANTNLEDARLAAELGADAVGFVFAPSTRRVTAEQVARIVPGLPEGVEKIGVFTTLDDAEIVETVHSARLTGVQLHGGFDMNLARRVRAELGNEVSIIQTIHWQVKGAANHADEVAAQLKEIALESAVDRVLVDSKTAKAAGGTGTSFDWAAAHRTLTGYKGRLIVAGGLRPENVVAAISTLGPWGVDVASGVEADAGRKDAAKLRQFIEEARRPE